jgi:glycosyltransferase involved in cell wall biosynthesis
LKLKHRPKKIIGFLPVAAGLSAILAPVLRLKLIVYCFEPHSEYMADFGIWKRNSLKFLLLRKYEMEQVEIASHIIVPTIHTRELVKKMNPYIKASLLPISIDTDQNHPDAESRMRLRQQLKINDKKVLLYMGKFGGIYYDIDTLIQFLNKFDHLEFHVLIISSDKKNIDEFIEAENLDKSFFTVLDYIPYDQIYRFISAADMGIVAVPPLPSQKYRTPVKTGLYLACGIPYLVNEGIAEDDMIALKYNIGSVVHDFMDADIRMLTNSINELLSDPDLPNRCRKLAIQFRSHHYAVKLIETILSETESPG